MEKIVKVEMHHEGDREFLVDSTAGEDRANLVPTMAKLIASYDALVDRALAIVETAPFWQYVHKSEFARLSIKDGFVVIRWPELEAGYYDSGDTIELKSATFPADMLLWSPKKLAHWQQEKKAEGERREQQRQADAARARDAEERRLFDALAVKYGKAPSTSAKNSG